MTTSNGVVFLAKNSLAAAHALHSFRVRSPSPSPRKWFSTRTASVFGNPLRWTQAQRCLFIAGVMLPGVLTFWALGLATDRWLFLPPDASPRLTQVMERLMWLSIVVWSVLLLVAAARRHQSSEQSLLVASTVQAFVVTTSCILVSNGVFYGPGWIMVIGGGVVGYLLFGKRQALFGLATMAISLLALYVAAHIAGPGTLLHDAAFPTHQDGAEWHEWTLRIGITTVAFASLTLFLCLAVIKLLRDREAELERLSKLDALTGVANRGEFMAQLAAEWNRASRYHTSLSCVMLDLDHFKSINDDYGHLAGDQLLQVVADALHRGVRENDLVARYGGEEFVLLLPNTDAQGAGGVAERCRRRIAACETLHQGRTLRVTSSFGVASYPGTSIGSADELLAAADRALYAAKAKGRNQVAFAPAA